MEKTVRATISFFVIPVQFMITQIALSIGGINMNQENRNQKIIARAAEVIQSKSGYIGGGMEGNAVLALIDENGYPTASVVTIANADGVKWITFNTSPGYTKTKRIEKCNRASVCIGSSEYNITLVGTIEVLTDAATKKDNWFEPMAEMWSGPDDPKYCVLRFNTEHYNLFFASDDTEAKGFL